MRLLEEQRFAKYYEASYIEHGYAFDNDGDSNELWNTTTAGNDGAQAPTIRSQMQQYRMGLVPHQHLDKVCDVLRRGRALG
jgi:hypothetical protein